MLDLAFHILLAICGWLFWWMVFAICVAILFACAMTGRRRQGGN